MQIATPNGSLDAPCESQNCKKGILSRIPFFRFFRKMRRRFLRIDSTSPKVFYSYMYAKAAISTNVGLPLNVSKYKLII